MWSEIKHAFLLWPSLDCDLFDSIFITEASMLDYLAVEARRAGKATFPDELKDALVDASVVANIDQLWITVHIAVAIRVAEVCHMASILSTRLRDAIITIVILDLVASLAIAIERSHVLDSAAQILEDSEVLHFRVAFNRLHHLGNTSIGERAQELIALFVD